MVNWRKFNRLEISGACISEEKLEKLLKVKNVCTEQACSPWKLSPLAAMSVGCRELGPLPGLLQPLLSGTGSTPSSRKHGHCMARTE